MFRQRGPPQPYVTTASVNDRTGLEDMVSKFKSTFLSLKKIWTDMGYHGENLKAKIEIQGIDLEIVRRPRTGFYIPNDVQDIVAYLKARRIELTERFRLLPRRWLVERTFAWTGRYRRMRKDYEFLTHAQETMMRLAMTKTMLKRITKIRTKLQI